MLIFELVLERRVLAEGIFAFWTPYGVLLPLRDLLEALELPIAVDPVGGTASGWFLAENRLFHLDLVHRTVTIEGRPGRFDPERVEAQLEEIYVEAELLGEWLPISFEVDLPSLRIVVEPREELPLQSRLERNERWSLARSRRGLTAIWEPRFPARPAPYRVLAWPLLDVDLGVRLHRSMDGSIASMGQRAVLGRGDFLGMTGELFLGDSARRLVVSRSDPDAGLLGPLRATEVRVGDVGSLNEALVGGGEMRGLEITNQTSRHWGSSSVFDRITLEGDTLPGWEVELYRNDVLDDFQVVGADGRYRFLDVVLHAGLNHLRLAFYGPHGERRERVERIFVSATLLPPGETRYRLGLYEQGKRMLESRSASGVGGFREVTGSLRLGLDVERGLSRSLAVAAGVSSLDLADGRHTYARAGLKTSRLGVSGRLRAVADARGGWALQAGAQRRFGRLGLSVEHLENLGLESPALRPDDPLGLLASRSEVRLETWFRLPRVGVMPLRVEAWRETRLGAPTGFEERLDVRARAGLNTVFRGWRLRPQQAIEQNYGRFHAPGELRVERRAGRMLVRGGVLWSLAPRAAVNGLDATGHLDLGGDLRLSLGVTHQLDSRTTLTRAGADWGFDLLRLRLDATGSTSGDLGFGASVGFGLGRETATETGRAQRWRMSEERRARQSAVIARVFLDRDGDGRYGPGDTTVPGARIEVDGRRRGETTDDRGLVRVPLIPYRHNDLGIAEGTLEDPFWVAAEEGRGFVGRPGVEWSADFPVLVTGEIEGTVYLERGGERSEVANVLLELVEAGGEVVATSKSQFDGFYLFERIRPGVYTVRAALEQSARLGFEIEPRKVALAGGEIEIGIDLVATEPEE